MRDAADRLTAIVFDCDGLAARETFAHDLTGNVVAQTDPLGRTMRHTFDAFSRRVKGVNLAFKALLSDVLCV